MSKLSPYTKRTNPYNAQQNKNTTVRGSDNIRGTKYIHNDSSHKNIRNQQQTPKLTQKKISDRIDMTNLIDSNRALATENQQLYQMLEERGHIITTLERKLQQQITRETNTLDAIQYQKNKFIADSHKKFKDYDCKIEELIQQICVLREGKHQGLRSQQLDLNKLSLSKKQMGQHSPLAYNHSSAREQVELELLKITNLLEMKSNQIEELQFEFRNSNDKFKNQIIGLNNEIVHLTQMHKIQFSDQKLQYENTIDTLKNEFQKEKEIIIIEHDLQFKQMEQLLTTRNMETNRVGEQKKMGEIQQSIRENQLMEQKLNLQNQIRYLEDFYRKRKVNEDQKLKELNSNQIQALSVGNTAIVTNLKTENQKLIHIINSKSEQIKALYNRIAQQRAQHTHEIQRLQLLIDQFKMSVQTSSKDHSEDEERLKIKWAELRDADIKSLSSLYQNQIDCLNHQLLQKAQESDSNRQKLYEELQAKSQMRKIFDIEILRLSSRIAELELKSNQLTVNKRQEVSDVNAQKSITSIMLARETKEKEKLNQLSEQQKRKLQELILAKDNQIEDLNLKIRLLKDNTLKEVTQKNYEIDLIKKAKDNLQIELQKQKLFFEKQLQRKEIVIRQNKQSYEQDMVRIKQASREQYDNAIGQLSSQKASLEVQLNRAKVVQKNLRNELGILQKHKQEELINKQEQLTQQKYKLTSTKKQTQDNLKKYYSKEIQKLQMQIGQLKIQLKYKEQDLRKQAEKYSQLEQKLEQVFLSQQKLKNMESMIIEMGQDNNLVKNLAQIIKPKDDSF